MLTTISPENQLNDYILLLTNTKLLILKYLKQYYTNTIKLLKSKSKNQYLKQTEWGWKNLAAEVGGIQAIVAAHLAPQY